LLFGLSVSLTLRGGGGFAPRHLSRSTDSSIFSAAYFGNNNDAMTETAIVPKIKPSELAIGKCSLTKSLIKI